MFKADARTNETRRSERQIRTVDGDERNHDGRVFVFDGNEMRKKQPGRKGEGVWYATGERRIEMRSRRFRRRGGTGGRACDG